MEVSTTRHEVTARRLARQLALWRWIDEHGWPTRPDLVRWAGNTGASLRTLYRDVATIRAACEVWKTLQKPRPGPGTRATPNMWRYQRNKAYVYVHVRILTNSLRYAYTGTLDAPTREWYQEPGECIDDFKDRIRADLFPPRGGR